MLEGRKNEMFSLADCLGAVWVDWTRFLAKAGWSWAFFSRQAGNGQCRVCQDRKPDWAPVSPRSSPLPPPPVHQPQWPCLHLRTSALQCCCVCGQLCRFPVFIPSSIPSLFISTAAKQVSAAVLPPSSMMWHLNHHSLLQKEWEKCFNVFSAAWEKWNWNFFNRWRSDGVKYNSEIHLIACPCPQLGLVNFQRR